MSKPHLIAIVLSITPLGIAAQQTPVLRATAEQRIGAVDGQHAFSDIAGIMPVDNGVYILERQEARLRLFSKNGEILATIGRRGSGPGEFMNPVHAGVTGDSVWIVDAGLGRITFIHDGAVVGSRELARNSAGPLTPVGFMRDGAVIAVSSERAGADSVDVVIFAVNATGVADTLLVLPRRNSTLAIRPSARRSGVQGLFARQPFADPPLYAFTPTSRVVVADGPAHDERGDATFRLTEYSGDGRTTFSRVYRYHPVVIEASVRDSVIDHWSEVALRARGPELPNIIAARKAVTEALYLPRFYPPIERLLVSSEGDIWVRIRHVEPDGRWLAFSPDGDLRAEVHSAPSHVVAVAEDHVWAIEHDDLGVAYAVRYRLEPSQ